MSTDLKMKTILTVFSEDSGGGVDAMKSGLLTFAAAACFTSEPVDTMFVPRTLSRAAQARFGLPRCRRLRTRGTFFSRSVLRGSWCPSGVECVRLGVAAGSAATLSKLPRNAAVAALKVKELPEVMVENHVKS